MGAEISGCRTVDEWIVSVKVKYEDALTKVRMNRR